MENVMASATMKKVEYGFPQKEMDPQDDVAGGPVASLPDEYHPVYRKIQGAFGLTTEERYRFTVRARKGEDVEKILNEVAQRSQEVTAFALDNLRGNPR